MEPGISDELDGVPDCPATSPGGWHCCLPRGHALNHIGTTEGWGKLYQWEPELAEVPDGV